MIKNSKYNHLLTLRQQKNATEVKLIYNALSGGLAEMEEKYIRYFKLDQQDTTLLEICEKKDNDENDKEKVMTQLLKGGFLIDSELSEIDFLRYISNLSRYSNNTFAITILPTLDCNFRCSYCYEAHRKGIMRKEVEGKIIELVQNKIKNKPSSLFIQWYGGEPLLCLNIIERISREFMKIGQENSIPFQAKMVTNGFLLDKATVNLLRELKIDEIQITLDGIKEEHDKRRVLISGKPTFDRIISNIEYASEHINIVLRINIDKNNITSAFELLNTLSKLGINKKKVSPYLGFLRATTSACKNVANNCFSEEEYALNNTKFIERVYELGFKSYSFPSPAFHLCGAVTEGVFAIDPDGNLFKCWETVAIPEEAVGNIMCENFVKPEYLANLVNWMSYDPFEYKECLECDIFPICFGGCASARVHHRSKEVFRTHACGPLRYTSYFNKMMEIVYSKYLRGDFKKEEETKKEASEEISHKEESKDKSTTNFDQAQEDIKDKSSQDLEN